MKMERLLRKFLVMGIVALFLGVVGSAFFKVDVNVKAVGATIYVDDDNTTGPWDGTEDHPCQNITSGLEQASDGDTVHVFSGTYVENVVVDKSVTLEGESKPVINGMTGHGIDVTANDVTIEGFNITYSGYCIYTGTSGFSIKNNIFWHDFDYDFYGIYWYISESSLAENYTVYPAVIEGNEFYMSGMYDAIYVNVNLDCGSNSGYNVEIGDIQICNNKFYMEGSTARGIDIGDIYVAYLYGGTVSFGVLNMSGNTMYGGDYGINFYGYLDDLQDVQASVGDVIVNDNILVNQSSYSMYVDYYDGTYLYGNTVGTYGDLIIRGNTITSVYNAYGIYISDIGYWEEFYDNASLEVGNVYIEENEIDVGDDGIYVYGYDAGYDLYDNSSFTMGYILVRDNNIKSDSAGIYVDFEIFGNYLYGASPFTMGNIEITSNLISNTYDGIYFYMYAFGYEMYGTSSFMMGSILANNNAINSTDYGICVDYIGDFGGAMYGNSSFTMGDIQLSGNTINSGNDGIHVDDIENFGVYMEENSTFAMGNIESSGNTINSTYFGICTIDLVHQFGYYMTGHSSFTMGHIRVNENVINNEGGSTGYNNAGIYVEYIEYLGNYMYNMSTFVMGNIEVSNNRINSTTYGIYLYEIDYSGYQMYDDSSFAMGDLLVNNNIINSAGDGMYLEYIEYFGQIMYGNSSFTMSNVQISGNVVNSTQRGIFIEDLYEFGSYMHDTSSFTMSNIEISNNKINSTLEGIYIQSFYHAYYMYNNASFAIEDILVNGNIINSKDNGIVLREAYHHTRFGYNAIDNATIITGNVEFCQNEITGGIDGIDLADLQNATIRNNIMQNCSLGIYLQDSANNSIYHNNFINNTLQAYVRALYTPTAYCNNTWDNGYPSGGNYWSEYIDIDNNSGPYQNITGTPDGIWDNPYIINENNTDRYPFVNLYDDTPPTIGIPSRTPSGDILPNQEVTVMVNVTDILTGVKNVTLYYTIDDGLHWDSTEMLRNPSTELYEAIIPGQECGETVRFKIEAFDYAGNNQTKDGVEAHCMYQVVPEFPSLPVLLAFMMTTLLLAIVFKERRTLPTRNRTQHPFFCLTEY